MFFFAAQKSETPSQPRPYSIGETAQMEILAPRKIAVIDPVATEVRRQMEAAKIPVVFLFDKDVSARAVANFSTEFVFTREKFLDTVEKNFKTRTLTTNQITLPRFRKMVNNFQAGNKSYPVNFREAAIWAQGNREENFLKELSVKLRQATERMIRPDSFSPTNFTFQVRILSGKEIPASLELVKQQSRLIRRTNFVSAVKARNELMLGFSKENRAIGKFLTNYVEANCIFDAELTRQFRAEKTNALWSVVPYEAGQVVVHRGELIDLKIKAALDELKIQTPVSPANDSAKQIWLWGGAIACAIFALLIGLFGFTRRPQNGLVPVGNVLVLPTVGIAENDLRARLMPHLARGLMHKFVRALISQRSELMRTQDAGTDQLLELEQRLEQINTRLQNRQAVYEKRIAELEKELAATEEENRELIRAKIHEARQNLERAKAQATGGTRSASS